VDDLMDAGRGELHGVRDRADAVGLGSLAHGLDEFGPALAQETGKPIIGGPAGEAPSVMALPDEGR
jgi:hypothetical protein